MGPDVPQGEAGLASLAAQISPPAEAVGITRLIVIDNEAGPAQVLRRRASDLGWQERVLSAPPTLDDLAAMHPGAIVLDIATCGNATWAYLEAITRGLPETVVLVVTTRSTVADRVR